MANKKTDFEMQEVFIKHLKQVVPANVSLVDDIADLLKISNDSAYRRLRNETVLSLDETYKICKHYRISSDSVFSNKGDSVTCNYIKLTDSSDNFESYLTSLLTQLTRLQKSKEAKIIYAAQEIPIFHSFFSKELAAFKLFYWQRSVLNVPEYQSKKFEWDLIPEKQVQLAVDIYQAYLQVPSTEIWTEETINTTIKQIDYYFESGAFKEKEDAILVLLELKKMVQAINRYAESENKNEKNKSFITPFNLYNSDLVIGTNCIHISMSGSVYSYISFNTMNSLTTGNQQFCEEIEHWTRNLIKKSTLISGIAEKQRFQFFSKAYKAIDLSTERIKNY
jgi:tetratricopeptide (TPR) repeat protein